MQESIEIAMSQDFSQVLSWLRPPHNDSDTQIGYLHKCFQNDEQVLNNIKDRYNKELAEKQQYIDQLQAQQLEASAQSSASLSTRADLERRLFTANEQLEAQKAKLNDLQAEIELRRRNNGLPYSQLEQRLLEADRENEQLSQLVTTLANQFVAERFERRVHQTASAAAFMLIPALNDQTTYNHLIAVTRAQCALAPLPTGLEEVVPAMSVAERMGISRRLRSETLVATTETDTGKRAYAKGNKRKHNRELCNLFIDTNAYQDRKDPELMQEFANAEGESEETDDASWREKIVALGRRSRKAYVASEWVKAEW